MTNKFDEIEKQIKLQKKQQEEEWKLQRKKDDKKDQDIKKLKLKIEKIKKQIFSDLKSDLENMKKKIFEISSHIKCSIIGRTINISENNFVFIKNLSSINGIQIEKEFEPAHGDSFISLPKCFNREFYNSEDTLNLSQERFVLMDMKFSSDRYKKHKNKFYFFISLDNFIPPKNDDYSIKKFVDESEGYYSDSGESHFNTRNPSFFDHFFEEDILLDDLDLERKIKESLCLRFFYNFMDLDLHRMFISKEFEYIKRLTKTNGFKITDECHKKGYYRYYYPNEQNLSDFLLVIFYELLDKLQSYNISKFDNDKKFILTARQWS